jgi:acetyl-CoA carboxylase carboxyl transferase subunit alpha
MHFLDFEQPLEELYKILDDVQNSHLESEAKQESVNMLLNRIAETRQKLYENLTAWQRVQVARHPERPYTLYYIKQLCSEFTELHGDRNFKDDKAIVGGLGIMDGQTVMFIGQQKGTDIKSRQYRNFGMPNPEGYRKALRLMKMAERFDIPIVTLIDTPGAFPGIDAENRGQAQAIAQNLYEMAKLTTPVICVVIGEGASGGALGIGVGNTVAMLENTWYTVISPEACSAILWRTADQKMVAAEALKLTANDALALGVIEEIIAEPIGGAHLKPQIAAENLRTFLHKEIKRLRTMTAEELVAQRIDRFSKLGRYNESK